MSVLPEPALLVQCADVCNNTPLINQRALRLCCREYHIVISGTCSRVAALLSYSTYFTVHNNTFTSLQNVVVLSIFCLFYSLQKYIEGPEGF